MEERKEAGEACRYIRAWIAVSLEFSEKWVYKTGEWDSFVILVKIFLDDRDVLEKFWIYVLTIVIF